MANNHDYVALDWVRGEIEETLNQARQALEAFVGNPDDLSRMRFCLNYIHQVHGTLQMVEFYGAALLAEEMEKLAQAMLNQEVPHQEEAQEVLMRAILQLPSYLERIQTGKRDLPVILLPILNDLRASRGENLLSDNSVFTPDLSPARISPPAEVATRLQDEDTIALLRKLRQMYQFSLAGIIRNHDLEANYGFILKVLRKLESLCQDTAQEQLWSVARALVEALAAQGLQLSSAAKTLLRHIDFHIKRTIDEHGDILLQPAPEDLLKHLLYYVAKSTVTTPHMEAVKTAYELGRALPSEQEVDEERQKLSGPDKGAIQSVVAAINEELGRIKDQLDLFVRGELKNNQDLAELLPGLHQIANTVAVLGLGIPRKVIQEQIALIQELAGREQPPEDAVLMDIAGALLYVEATLVGMSEDHGRRQATTEDEEDTSPIPKEQLEAAHDALIREARNGLEQAKNDVVEFIASHWDHNEIRELPALLHSIRGGLAMIPLSKAAELLRCCANYVQDVLLDGKSIPDWQQLDTLADAITSIEYYLERLAEGSIDNDPILEVAEQSVEALGYPLGKEPVQRPQAADETALADQPLPSNVAPDTSAAKEMDQELIDDDIIEIFVEEADEVLQTIAHYFPQYQQDPDNKTALVELRRAFHTLKGSGRLVGATVIGELAWSIENMLNQLIDGSLSPNLEVFELLQAVIGQLPQLIGQFRNGEAPADVSSFIGRAEALTQTRKAARQAREEETAEPAEAALDATPETDSESAVQAPAEEPAAELETPDREEEATEIPVLSVEPDPMADLTSIEAPDQGETAEAADDDLIDDEILEIFVEEAAEVLETIQQFLPQYLGNQDDREALTEVRRAFHTLKGSGRLVGATDVGETAWAIENLLNRIIDGTLFMSVDIAEVVQAVTQILPDLVEDFRLRRAPSHQVEPYQNQAHALARGEIVEPLAQMLANLGQDTADADTAAAKPLPEQPAVEATELAIDAPETEDATDEEMDPVLLEIFRSETETHLQSLERFVANARANGQPVALNDDISRALHTLKGSAHTANIEPIAKVAVPVERYIKEARALNVPASQTMVELLDRLTQFIRAGVEQLAEAPQRQLPGTDEFLSDVAQAYEEMLQKAGSPGTDTADNAPDPQMINIFLTEGVDILLDAESILSQWRHNPVPGDQLEQLVNELLTLAQGAKVAGLDDIAELCLALEQAYELAESGSYVANDEFFATVQHGHEVLLNMMDQVAAGLATQPDQALLEQLRRLTAEGASASLEEPVEAAEESLALDIPLLEDSLEPEAAETGVDADELPTLDSLAPQEESPAEQAPEAASPMADLDPELVGIFLEEASDIIDRTSETIRSWSQQAGDQELVAEIQRDLHTLKGGARMAEISAIGDLAHELETLFEHLAEGRTAATAEMYELVQECHDRLATMVDQVSQGQACQPAPDLISQIQNLDSADTAAATLTTSLQEAEQTEAVANVSVETFAADAPEAETEYSLGDLDPELVEIFLEEAQDILDNTATTLHEWLSNPTDLNPMKVLQRDVHTLKGGARLADLKPIGDLSHELENLFEGIVEGRFTADASLADLLTQCHDRLASMVEATRERAPLRSAPDLISAINAYCSAQSQASARTPDQEGWQPAAEPERALEPEQAAADSDLVAVFLDEAKDLLQAAQTNFGQWRAEPANETALSNLTHDLHTLKGGARMAEIRHIGDLSEALYDRLLSVMDGGLTASDAFFSACEQALTGLDSMLQQLDRGEPMVMPTQALQAITAFTTPVPAATEVLPQDAVDPEILQVFLEEAQELGEQLENSLADWSRDPQNPDHTQNLLRALHTLKGGARLANLDDLGNLSHGLEDLLKESIDSGRGLDEALKQEITSRYDQLQKAIDTVRTRFRDLHGSTAARPQEPDSAAKIVELQRQQMDKPLAEAAPTQPQPASPAASRTPAQQQQETIRVSAPLLDELVNLAGETSIARSRLEQQISDFSHTLEEMGATVDRLREQLRRMEIETEAQVLFRQERQTGPDYADFDPLEMDRYSTVQQLSRALSESASDLMDLKETMADKVRDAETLLLQQSRINTELQEGLMKTRMVPFSSMVPRLRRIVRQIAGELNKKIEFEVYNPEGELDRNVLERMVAPLEHMLRNAVDHGIESAEARRKAGKPETGHIELSLGREGGDVVLVLADDGGGINVDAVRRKAIAQGLLDEQTEVTDHEVMQFIMQPGFSTAQQVTQISGRGVGMDVVASEIKQLGGRVTIDSTPGQGTRFIVRLPFTVSVNRALMVSTGEDFYAIPLNTIEGIVRVSSYELEEYYKPDAPLYEYAGQRYRLQYLGSLLHQEHQPKLQGQVLPLPVILVRGGEQPLALQVDSLMGSREIVVKSLGPQFAQVRGVSGATILGDGSVVVILDLPAMIRADVTTVLGKPQASEPAATSSHGARPLRVMVVDDSVTVRKVTSRLLERNGMDVLTAKDGVDAIALLQDHKPDIMLLDIEMPRMDCFEVASLVRHDERLKDVPIIMITSRTGQKHRERAMTIGVNEYLGKPFQEKILLETIERLTS